MASCRFICFFPVTSGLQPSGPKSMASVLAQSSNADASFLESSEALVQSLDILLERYLNLLDSYQSSRERLTGHLSSVRV